MKKLDYPASTKGEVLFQFVRRHLSRDDSLTKHPTWLTQIDDSENWNHYIEESMVLALMGRILVGGRRLRTEFGNSSLFQTELKSSINQSLSLDKNDLNRMLRLTAEAIRASEESISKGIRKSIRSWARLNHSSCYLCGEMLNFDDADDQRSFTLDHVWPRDFGGDSKPENLLPACKECNNDHKRNFPTWAMTNVHALILSRGGNLDRVEGCSRFAIQHRMVQRMAINERMSLREAYLKHGGASAVVFIDPNTVGHFFNLAITN